MKLVKWDKNLLLSVGSSSCLDRVEVRGPLGKAAIQSSDQILRLWATVVPWGQVCSLWLCLGLRYRESGGNRMAASLLPWGLTSH